MRTDFYFFFWRYPVYHFYIFYANAREILKNSSRFFPLDRALICFVLQSKFNMASSLSWFFVLLKYFIKFSLLLFENKKALSFIPCKYYCLIYSCKYNLSQNLQKWLKKWHRNCWVYPSQVPRYLYLLSLIQIPDKSSDEITVFLLLLFLMIIVSFLVEEKLLVNNIALYV